MANVLLESSALSAFCESIATMHAAGIQVAEAVHMLSDTMNDSPFKRTCSEIYRSMVSGVGLTEAMETTGAFPKFAVDMVRVGERSGRLENVLRSLSVYYDEEDRLFAKIRSSVGYPAALLCIMSVILAFTVAIILPVFVNVYENLSGSLTAGSFSAVTASIIIGWVALIVTLICTIIALIGVGMCRTERGRLRIMKLFESVPSTRQAMYQLALSRFTSAASTYIASGINTDEAIKRAMETVDHAELRRRLEPVYNEMVDLSNPKSLAQAIADNDVYEPIYARMLLIGSRTGNMDEVLDRLSSTFFEDAILQIDRAIDSLEPALAAFITIAVGLTLIAVMLPLIGIMGSIG